MADLDAMKSDLVRAGWVEERTYIWRAPNGALFLGPSGAWRALKRTPSVMDVRDRSDGRLVLIQRAMRLRVEIEQVFTDCASWNDSGRQPHEPAIDCDPDGKLRRMADGLDRMLEKEAARG